MQRLQRQQLIGYGRSLLDILAKLCSSTVFMALLLLACLVVYFRGISGSIDYPRYDESFYFRRGFDLASGNVAAASLSDPRSYIKC